MAADGLTALQDRVRRFAEERDWGQFHTPKNLVMALAGEVGELIAHFQWLTPAQSDTVMADPATARAVADELADVLIYLVRLGDVLGVDLLDAAERKLAENAERYPADQARGSAAKAPRTEAADG
jgi:NTP pyrophosphatase (non-canonical NTP hydrolase)